ncbi:IMPACT family protein [Raineyella sp. LH-20]|uniref:IMPACT family protein n=1 Tax=Raineyella sp. LH-20 TaxID=3081204 RepID=UPI0029534804|nr:YigZ family protein [Raineyella sp. LH-20]WOP19885.1 YigZ family protein [Raineyella sp. LH-20]
MSTQPRVTIPHGVDVTTELEVKRSRFITLLRRVDDEAAARALLAEARDVFPDARHHCSAWVVSVPDAQPLWHSSDDGEPSGTAGRPMLDVLLGSGLTDVAAVVVRYFGGTLLGTGGLVRAYSDAVASALDQAPRVLLVTSELWSLLLPHAEAGRIESELRGRGVAVHDVAYVADGVRLTLATQDRAGLGPLVAALTRGEGVLVPAGRTVLEEPCPGPSDADPEA